MSNKQNRRDKMRRIVALAMVLFLLLSVFASVIFYLITPVLAAEADSEETTQTTDTDTEIDTDPEDTEAEPDETDPEDTSANTEDTTTEPEVTEPEPDEPTGPEFDYDIDIPALPEPEEIDDKLIRVGLMYGTSVTVGFEVDTTYGFYINKVNRTGDLSSEPIWDIDLTKVSCTVDHNLSKYAMTYSKTSSAASTVVGGYHIELGVGLTREETIVIMNGIQSTLDTVGVYAIPSYINGGYRIRIGHYATEELAANNAAVLSALLGGMPLNVAKPTNTAVSLVDPLTDKILFEYDCGDVTALGLTPKSSPSGEKAYLVTPAKKLYDGTFMFRRYISGATDGVSLTDIIELEEYIEGVVPYEISSSWPEEALKAFAIMVRSYTLAGTRHESSYQVDICNSTHCQVYGGRTKVNAAVEKAVEATKGLVMEHNGNIAYAYYSAVTGGVTISSYDAWGYQHIPYLVAVETPWENYNNHSYGVWTAEVSPTTLLSHLNSKGYTNLRGSIKSISIDKFCENSTYVRDITFTDVYGNKATIKASANVFTALSKYVNSANFVVGKGSVEAVRSEFYTTSAANLDTLTAYGTESMKDVENITVLTAGGEQETTLNHSTVISANGKFTLGDTTSVPKTVTVTAKDPNNFIFAGLGWGHGVGASQIGLRDLAKLGYKAEDILPKYYTGVNIVDWRDVK